VITPKTCVIALSQSGETADTLSAIRELKARGVQILSLCNVQESTLARESDSCLFLKAGPEIGVCSTKAFTSQMVVLSLFTLLMARMRNMDSIKGQEFIEALTQLPDKVQEILNQADQIAAIAKKYAKYDHFFYIGRNYMYPAALEGALKLKESSYVNANAYPGGELKHGPIALINPECPTIALCANDRTREKIMSNLMEIKARGGSVVAITDIKSPELERKVDDVIYVPRTLDPLAIILSTVATQLFAYFIAKERGVDIDRPRNLAKAVTVE
jgi:glutamine---fructose-6-phosphate transaminase (isomerizing)